MRASAGPPVVGEDFFDREIELRQLASRVQDGNHVLLTGQRRMGKTSIAMELGARLEREGSVFLYIDVEGETSEEAMVASLAEAVHPVRAVSARLAGSMKELLGEGFKRVHEVSASEFRVKIRSGLNQQTWRRRGRDLIRFCADHDAPVLIVIDEFPIFLTRLLKLRDGRSRVEGLLSWLRATLQESRGRSPVVLLSGTTWTSFAWVRGTGRPASSASNSWRQPMTWTSPKVWPTPSTTTWASASRTTCSRSSGSSATSLLPDQSALRPRMLPTSTAPRCWDPPAKPTSFTTRSAFATLWKRTATSRSL